MTVCSEFFTTPSEMASATDRILVSMCLHLPADELSFFDRRIHALLFCHIKVGSVPVAVRFSKILVPD
jgi:hypothetical protein